MSALAEKQHLVSKVAARKNGVAVTFTLTVPGAHSALTDTFTDAVDTTVVGVARRVRGDPERYKALELVESEAPTLEFTPDTYGEQPPPNSRVTFGGVSYTCRDIEPWAPDGSAISCRVVVAR